MNKGLSALAIVLCAVTTVTSCRTIAVESAPNLEEEVYRAVRIARVTVEQVEPVRHGISVDSQICGYKYAFKVVEPFKGDQQPFVVFAATSNLLLGHDYLVFVHGPPPNELDVMTLLEDVLNPAEQKMLSCRLSASKYLLPVNRQTFFAFDGDAKARWGGEWLAWPDPGSIPGFRWCDSDVQSARYDPNRDVFRLQEVGKGSSTRRFFSWESAQRLIGDALHNSPYWWGGIPNPTYKPKSC